MDFYIKSPFNFFDETLCPISGMREFCYENCLSCNVYLMHRDLAVSENDEALADLYDTIATQAMMCPQMYPTKRSKK